MLDDRGSFFLAPSSANTRARVRRRGRIPSLGDARLGAGVRDSHIPRSPPSPAARSPRSTRAGGTSRRSRSARSTSSASTTGFPTRTRDGARSRPGKSSETTRKRHSDLRSLFSVENARGKIARTYPEAGRMDGRASAPAEAPTLSGSLVVASAELEDRRSHRRGAANQRAMAQLQRCRSPRRRCTWGSRRCPRRSRPRLTLPSRIHRLRGANG